ncbi:MAG: PsiF family protein, partial [Burkholderiales bacterium]
STAFAQQPQGEAKKGAPAAEKKAQQAKKEPSPAQLKQQERMRQCSGDAKAKGISSKEERNKFMSACLKGETADAKPATQQDRMKSCNKEAGNKQLKGEDRKKFMSSCLKG